MAQRLPQPAVAAIHEQCNGDNESRGLWYDQFGDVDVHFPGTWFYTKATPPNVLQIFIDRPATACTFPYMVYDPPAIPPYPPNFACLDYDHVTSDLWGGAYDGSGRYWKINNNDGWINWFGTTDFFIDTFVHDNKPTYFDAVAVAADSSLYLGPDLAFNLFHVDARIQNDPVKLSDSLILPFPRAGVEVEGNYLFLAGSGESRIYVYSRVGNYPIGYFAVRDVLNRAIFIEDLDLRTEGQHLYLVGNPEISNPQFSIDLLQWDVKSLIVDSDSDGVPNVIDNCDAASNDEQYDSNGDGIGDACTPPYHGDEDDIASYLDNCPYTYNPRQGDADRDGRGDACDNVTHCFGGETQLGLPDGVVDIAIADLDNDGDGDVVTLHHKRYSGNSLFNFGERRVDLVSIRWSGTHGSIGELSEPATYAVANQGTSRDLVLADVNRDGFVDIAVVHDNTVEPSDPFPPEPPDPQVAIAPGVTVLWNDRKNHFGMFDHVNLRHEDGGPVLYTGHPVAMFAIHVDGPNDPYPELVVVGRHQYSPGNEQGTITLIRYSPQQGGELDADDAVGLTGVPIHAIVMPPEVGKPEQDIAVLRNDGTVAIHRCMPGTAPYFDTTGYSAPVVGSNGQTVGRNLAYGFFRHTDVFDLAVIPDEGGNGSQLINFFINNPVAQTLTLGHSGTPQQLTTTPEGRLWRVIRYPSSPYDGVVILNQVNTGNATQGVQVTRFNATGLASGTFDTATREDMLDNSDDPARAVMALGDLSRSCGRDLLVADYLETVPAYGGDALPGLSFARCPFDAASRSFDRPAPSTPTCAVIADVTGTNGPDLVVGTAFDEGLNVAGRVMVFRQTPGIPNRFAYPPLDPPEGEVYRPHIGPIEVDAQILAMASGDFGAGSLPDLVIGFDYFGQQYLQVLRRTSATAFEVRAETFVTNTGMMTALTTGDFDNDGRTDVITLIPEQTPSLFLSRGKLDGALDAVEPIDDNTSYIGAALLPIFNPTTSRLDLLALRPVDAINPSVRILRNNGGGSFGSPTDLEIPTPPGGSMPRPVAVAIGKLPGVSAPYIACADADNRHVLVFIDSGTGYYLSSTIVVNNDPNIRPTSLVTADVEADGDDDIIVGFEDGFTVSLLTCLGVRFSPMTLPSGFRPSFVTAGDVDGNGLPDILEVGGGFSAEHSHLRVIYSNCGGM